MTEQEKFEEWYVENAFDYPSNPIGSRDCGLQRKAWNARQPEIDALRKELDHQKSQNNFDATRLMRLCNFCGVSMPESQEEQLQVAGVLIGSCLRELAQKFGELSQELEQVKMHNASLQLNKKVS